MRGIELDRHNPGNRQPARGNYRTVVVYSGAHVRRCVAFSGVNYDIEPFGTAEIHPHLKPFRDEEGNMKPGPWENVLTAEEVVEVLCSEEQEGRFGLVGIPQDATEEEILGLKEDAREKWFGAWSAMSENEIAEWESSVSQLRVERPGELPPKPPRRIRAFYEFRKLRRNAGLDRKPHVCLLCGLDFDGGSDLMAHQQWDHPNVPNVASATAVISSPQTRPGPPADMVPAVAVPQAEIAPLPTEDDEDRAALAPRPAVVPRPEAPAMTQDEKVTRERGRQLFFEAKRLGIEISVGDQKGLRMGDVEVLADIERKVKEPKYHAPVSAGRKGKRPKK